MSAAPARHLALVELDDQGEVIGRVESEALQTLEAKAEKLATDFKLAEKDLARQRRVIAELTRDKTRERIDHPDREFIVRVCKYWARKCRPKATRLDPLAPNRFDAVAALAEMQGFEMVEVDGRMKRVRCWRYSAEMFKAAIDGGAFDAYTPLHKNGKPNPQNDLEQLCRDVTRFERYIEKAPYVLGTFAGGDLVVPAVAGFERLGPKEVAAGLGTRKDSSRVPSRGPAQAAPGIGGSHAGLEPGHSCQAGRVEGRPVSVRARLAQGAGGLPASWT